MKLNETTFSLYIVGIVGIVAAVALVLMIFNSVSTGTVSGAAVQSTTISTTEWTTCLDIGNAVKLGNHEASTLTKIDVCTGDSDKMISYVSCAQDINGYYTYKYSNAVQCAHMESCLVDSENNAYCG